MLRFLKIVFIGIFLVGCAGSHLKEADVAEVQPVHNITLLLPLKGAYATSSQAIRNGFLAAYYYARTKNSDINIKVVDTSDGDVGILYQQAVASKADVIVGPLTKEEVGAVIATGPLTVPTIALNTLDDYSNHVTPNLYQFGLLPQDESLQVATKILGDGHHNVAVIAPNNLWGQKITDAFTNKYIASGGKVVATLNYDVTTDDLASQICNFIAADPSKLCVKQKHKNKNKEVIVDALQRRQDIDAIFLVTTPRDARQIVPLLKFYYAGDIPTYSTSAIFSGNMQPNLDQDINGVMFCDMPWVLQDSSALSPQLQAIRAQIVATWPDSYVNYSKLYALGIDSFNLAVGLSDFLKAPQSGFPAASGTLFLDNYNHIYRELEWTKMQV